MTVPVNRAAVREFITTIVAQAKAALKGVDKPGYLQMSRLHPTDEKLVPSRYTFDDGERMISDAIAACEAGHNVYIEARTIREDAARGNGRGELKDTAYVFAMVADSDADTGKGWKPNGTTPPSMVVETSPENFQFWFFFGKAIAADIGQTLGKGLRAATGTDHDTGVVTQPYRVAGTVNYPNRKKIERGRVTVPTRLVDFNPEVLWTQEQFEKAFAKWQTGTNVPVCDGGRDDPAGPQPDEAAIPADTMRVIREGVPEGQRSDAFWNVMIALKRIGFTVDGIVTLLERHPDGIAKKYEDEGRLRHEVERAYDKIRGSQPAPTIRVVQGEIPRIVDEAEDALLRLGLDLYQFGIRLVEPHLVLTKTSGGREILRWRLPEVTAINLVEYFSVAARFVRFDKRSKGWVTVDPPSKIAAAYLARRKKRVPHIAGIVNTPFLRADGTICDREGYDPATAVLCKWDGVTFPPVPLNPTKQDALDALKVLEEPLAEFPFVTPADRSAALSAILTPLDRKGVDTVPMHGFTAPAAGTGKGLLEDVIAVIATGRPMPSDNQGADEEEQEKRLGASLIIGDCLISIDNCERPLEGACLASAVTQHTLQVRILGKSEKVECPNTASIFANGNNLIIGADMTRRVIRCEMDAQVERPENRKFKVDHLLKTVQANRVQLVIAGLIILRAWLLARSTESVELTPLDFEEWSARVRSALVWLGRPDPGDTMQASRANDPHQVNRAIVFAEWHRVIGEREVLQRDILEAAIGDPTFQLALLAIAARHNSREISPERLGTWLAKNKGKIAGGFRLVFCGNTNKGPLWRVEPAANGHDGEGDLAI